MHGVFCDLWNFYATCGIQHNTDKILAVVLNLEYCVNVGSKVKLVFLLFLVL